MNVTHSLAITLFLASLWVSTADAYAMDCQGIGSEGHCVDSKTVEWCDNGVLHTATCPENEICAKHKDYGDGYLCISKDLTACAGIPDAGLCQTETQAVWCLEGELATKECGADEFCAQHDDHDWVDCVPVGERAADVPTSQADSSSAESESDAGSSDDALPPSNDEVISGDSPGPTPNVKEGKPWQAQEPDGCQGGSTSPLWAWVALLFCGIWLRRERLTGRF
jgi:hypothetical protein